MSEEWAWHWGAGSQPERFFQADCREDAIEQATEEALDNGYEKMTICEGKPWELNDDVFDADRVLEDWHDKNEDCMDEDGELRMNPTEAQRVELVASLNAAFKTWRSKHKLGRSWAMDTRNDEVLKIDLPAEHP